MGDRSTQRASLSPNSFRKSASPFATNDFFISPMFTNVSASSSQTITIEIRGVLSSDFEVILRYVHYELPFTPKRE